MHRFRIGRALFAWAHLAGLALIASVQTKLIGDFARFEQSPHENPEVDPPITARVTHDIGGDCTRLNCRLILENPFLGVNCYVGSLTAAIGTERTATRTYALRSLTFSPA